MRLIRGDLIDDKPLQWLWPGHVPIGVLTVVDGDPGTGKSQLTLAMAAIVSTGADWPDGTPCELGEVIVANAEDPEEEVIKPRLRVAGADCSKVFVICAGEQDSQIFTIPDHVAALESQVRERHVRLIIFDPLEAFLSGSVDNYRNHHVRRALKSLELMAKRTGCAIVIVRHLTKDATKAAIYRGGGSIGIIGAARAGLSIGHDPVDKERCIIVPTKANWSKMPEGLAYRIEEVNYVSDEGAAIQTSRVKWDGAWHGTADDLLTVVEGGGAPVGAGADAPVRAFIEAELLNGPVSSNKLMASAVKAGIKKADMFRVSRLMGVLKYKEGITGEGEWLWEMPEKQDEATLTQWAGEKWGGDAA
jgi:hypothetical protein